MTKDIQQEIEKDTEKMFKKIDKIIEKEFGKMCPEFEVDCIQCKVHLIYNEFKNRIWQEHVKN